MKPGPYEAANYRIRVAPSGWEGRGLKLLGDHFMAKSAQVAPSGWEGRGLKLGHTGESGLVARRSFRLGGAWIETLLWFFGRY